MALSLKTAEADELARSLARLLESVVVVDDLPAGAQDPVTRLHGIRVDGTAPPARDRDRLIVTLSHVGKP